MQAADGILDQRCGAWGRGARRIRRSIVGAVLGAILCQPALAAWPDDRPIELVLGFTAGGGTDVMARKLLPHIEKRLGPKAKLIVINRPGATGEIANGSIARAEPDGYTIGIVNLPGFLFQPMTKRSQYAPEQFRLLGRVVDDPTVLVVRADSKLTSLKDIVESLRAKPRSLSFGHVGAGSNGHLAIQMLAEASKVEFNDVPYRGAAVQKTDLVGGHIDVGTVSVGEVAELHGGATGVLRVVAQLTKVRSPALPDVPTAEEAGYPVLMSSERGFAAPIALPDEIVRKLETAIADALHDPEYMASSPGDVPVLSYLTGQQWKEAMDAYSKVLQGLADRMPK